MSIDDRVNVLIQENLNKSKGVYANLGLTAMPKLPKSLMHPFENLDLSGNKITSFNYESLPDFIKSLNMSGNKLSELDGNVFLFSKINEFNFEGNNISVVKDVSDFNFEKSRSVYDGWEGIKKKINLVNNNLETLPKNLCRFFESLGHGLELNLMSSSRPKEHEFLNYCGIKILNDDYVLYNDRVIKNSDLDMKPLATLTPYDSLLFRIYELKLEELREVTYRHVHDIGPLPAEGIAAIKGKMNGITGSSIDDVIVKFALASFKDENLNLHYLLARDRTVFPLIEKAIDNHPGNDQYVFYSKLNDYARSMKKLDKSNDKFFGPYRK